MSIQILIREHPHRSIALVAQNHALIFHHSPSTFRAKANNFAPRTDNCNLAAPCCTAEFTSLVSNGLNDYHSLYHFPVHGTLGLITIGDNIFLGIVTESTQVANVRPGETVMRILGVEFYCLDSNNFENTLKESLDSYPADNSYYSKLTSRDSQPEHPCIELQRLLTDGSFYYSTDFDLTNQLQDRNIEIETIDMDNMDRSFLWNSYMIDPLIRFRSRLLELEKKELDRSKILTSAIRGFAFTFNIPSYAVPRQKEDLAASASLTLISRLSCKRAGTRFNSRGIDDDGNVANFVESETIYWSSPSATSIISENQYGVCFSYVQVRGSVPLFWEQAVGLLPNQQKISIIRSSEGMQLSFDKHFSELNQKYGSVHVVNLLGETKPCEAELTRLYHKAVQNSRRQRPGKTCPQDCEFLKETIYDFHAETRGSNGYEAADTICGLLQISANAFAYYLLEIQMDSNEDSQKISSYRTTVVSQQQGVFRTNCLDCLDRTNLIQTIISKMGIEIFLAHRHLIAVSDFWTRHSTLWADNGDALSRIYAGTGALKSSFTRHGKMSLAGAISDARKSATRLYIGNFADKGRQNTIDVLLGRLVQQEPIHLSDPINDFVMHELSKNISEYQSFETIKIWCGTFNVNGRILGPEDDLSSWLYPGLDSTQQTPEIVAAGFQEIVELNPQQLMSTDPTRRELWEEMVIATINKRARYVLLRTGQLVGASLMIFVKKTILPYIRNVEGSVKKTGMSGMAGNKGAVAIRMDYANTSLCFVTAHLAAGHSNYEDRNNDYNTIDHGLRFQRNRRIGNHDSVIWMGDFNYRIELENEKVKRLLKNSDLDNLFFYDQLNSQMSAGLVFPCYSESQITFQPTYKFDLRTDNYDTSEKSRIPAWTDRILFKGSNLRQINYDTAPLRFSDHRPVYATFLCTVNIINESLREALSRRLYEDRRVWTNNLNSASSKDITIHDHSFTTKLIRPDVGLKGSENSVVNSYNNQVTPSKSNPSDQVISNLRLLPNQNTSSDDTDWVTVPRISLSKSLSSSSIRKVRPQITRSISSDFSGKSDFSLIISSDATPPIIDNSQGLKCKNYSENNLKAQATILPVDCHNDHYTSLEGTNHNSKIRPPPVARKPTHLSSSALPTFTSIVSPSASDSKLPFQVSNKTDLGYQKLDGEKVSKSIREPPILPPPRRTAGYIKRISSRNNLENIEEAKSNIMDSEQSNPDLLGNDSQSKDIHWKALKPA